ncbi:hypothetical protein SAMN02910276_00649 [Butyrivibrio sp. Su6]|uniref:hypothetical protein n=1 Tax=Butyrivibrio sp. Su6 TaxID=1520810 RepID=UPI00089E53FE|nr:hypothetical protein [Butyrivibrio sp. Su6]SEF62213.1 hypothetical protein SAMN02910276_00649 [Butyrivibrio sp. Su6]
MEITTDVILKGTDWNRAIDKLSAIFSTRTNYSIFMLCLAIGIMYDQRIETPSESGEEPKYVPRNVINNNDNGQLDFYFQAAILSTTTESLTEEKKLELAFGDEKSKNGEKSKDEFNKLGFLVSFANFGVTKLVELIGNTDLESMEKIKNFMISTVEGRNLEIDDLPLDDLMPIDIE